MDLIEKLNWRYATKKFDTTKKVSESDLKQLLEAVNLTPTSLGIQLQNVVVIENKELRESLVPVSYGQNQVMDASHLLVLCSEAKVDEDRVDAYMNRVAEVRDVPVESLKDFRAMAKMYSMDNQTEESLKIWLDKQVYIALGNLMTSAAIMGIDACPMEGFDPAKYDEILGLKEKGLRSVVVVPIGYRSEEDPYIHLKKVRKELSDFVVEI